MQLTIIGRIGNMWVRIKLKVKPLDSRAVVDVNSLGILSL